MTEIRPYYSTRQIIDVDSFLSERDDYYLMCVSRAQLHALRIMAKTRLLWSTSWAKERYETTYLLPDTEDWDDIHAHISEFIAESEVVEVCNTQMVAALERIATAIGSNRCCEGNGPGAQMIDNDLYYGTETPIDAPTAFGPSEEFETEAEYNAHRCATANAIVEGVIGSLNGMSVLTLASLVVGSVAVAVVGIGLLTVPPVAILIALAGTGLAFTFLSTLADEIADNREALVCALYNSTTAVDAYDNFKSAIEGLAVDLGLVEIEVGAVSDLVMNLAPIDTMNALFSSVGLPSLGGQIVDCDNCNTCTRVLITYGTLVDLTGDTVEIDSEDTGGGGPHPHAIQFWVNSNGTTIGEICGPQVDFERISSIGLNAYGGGEAWNVYDETDTLVYQSDTPPSVVLNSVWRLTVRSTTPWTLVANIPNE